jgi:hypothetical protein
MENALVAVIPRFSRQQLRLVSSKLAAFPDKFPDTREFAWRLVRSLDIESGLLVRALREAGPSSWTLIEAVLPELRREINARPLGGDARQLLGRSLPSLGYDDNWDLNRRIMLALHGLQKRTTVSRPTSSGAGLADAEIDFVYARPKEEPKRRGDLFWWLG